MTKRMTFLLALAVAFTAVEIPFSVPVVEAAKSKKAKKTKRKAKSKTAQAKKERTSAATFDVRAAPVGSMDARADKKRDEAIAKLKKLLPTMSAGPQKAELFFRLAEKYWSKSRFLYLTAMSEWDKSLDAWNRAGSKGKAPQLSGQPALADSNVFKREALSLYRTILKKYPRYPRKDEVYYNLGSSLYEAGKKKQGIKLYIRLLKQFPK